MAQTNNVMASRNYFWLSYKNLENEFIALGRAVHYCEAHFNVFSCAFADLITRCAIDIEAISKLLYSECGGPTNIKARKGKSSREPYFDRDCLALLETRWKLSTKAVEASGEIFFFKNPVRITPLAHANRVGNRARGWKRAYQKLKHSRLLSLELATMKNTLHALGALYILNLYLADRQISMRETDDSLDERMGSALFSVKAYNGTTHGVLLNGDLSLSAANTVDPSCTYVVTCDEDWLKKTQMYRWEVARAVEDRLRSYLSIQGVPLEPDTNIMKLYADSLGTTDCMGDIVGPLSRGTPKYNAVLNTGQNLYVEFFEWRERNRPVHLHGGAL